MPTLLGWVRHLEKKISEQTAYERPYNKRYRNEYVMPFIESEYRQVYGDGAVDQMLAVRPPKSGIAAIGIDALTERLRIVQATTAGSSPDEKEAVRLVNTAWEDSDLDVMHPEAHREAQIASRAWGLVSKEKGGSRSIGSVESARQCAGHRMSAPPYDTEAWLKISTDEWTGKRTALLLRPGWEYDFEYGDVPVPDPEDPTGPQSRWRLVGEPRKSGLTYVPAFEFPHQPRLLDEPQSEIERIETEVDIVDLIEGLLVFAGHFGAVPIRYAENLYVPRDPQDPSKPIMGPDGKPAIGFKPRADHFWVGSPALDKDGKPVGPVKFGQLTPASLDGFVSWANHAAGKIRSQTKVASTYYSLELKSHMSAELLKTDEAPMVRRVLMMGRNGAFGSSWRRFMQAMLEVENPALARKVRMRPLWEDANTRIESAAVDSFMKATAGGIGVKAAAQEFLGWSPEQAEAAALEAEEAKARQAAASADPVAAQLLRDAGLLAGNPGA